MALFMVKKGTFAKSVAGHNDMPADLEFTLYFHVLGVRILGDPGEPVSGEESGEAAQGFGGDHIEEDLPEKEEEICEEESNSEEPFS
jgi:hypothetical protein